MLSVKTDIQRFEIGISRADQGLAQHIKAIVYMNWIHAVAHISMIVLPFFFLCSQLAVDVGVDALEAVQVVEHGNRRCVWC